MNQEQVYKIMKRDPDRRKQDLKLTNVVSRRIQPEEFNNMQIVLTRSAQLIQEQRRTPSAPSSQCIKLPPAPTLSPKSI